MLRRLTYLLTAILIIAALRPLWAAPDVRPAEAEIRALLAKAPRFHVIPLPKGPRNLTLTPEQSLTVDDLRGVKLDDAPPRLGALAEPYDANQTDDFAPGTAPYVAQGIEPFRFRYFNLEFNYGGWHNLAMHDYVATHGFNIIYPYVRKKTQRSRMPAGTKWLQWIGFNWDEWMGKHKIASGRWDQLADVDVVGELTAAKYPEGLDPADWDYLMIDIEYGALDPEALRKQDWYPKAGTEAERQAFEAKYYRGYALAYTAPVQAAHARGFRNVSLYGWQPFTKAWYGLENLKLDPATYWPWQRFGKSIYQCPALDILNPDDYVYYWSPQNVAFTLSQIDLCREVMNSLPGPQKPVRPYYWTLLHGGDADYHWWSSQPVANEDARAWTTMSFFTGCDGFDLWNWSEIGNHHLPRPLKYKVKDEWKTSDIMVKDSFSLRPENAPEAAPPTKFERYDAIHVVSVDDQTGIARFQKIEPANYGGKFGLTPDKPVYAMPAAQLTSHLRAESEPISGLIEGLALAKPFEYILRHGEVKIDVSSLSQYLKTLPIVRRVKLGAYHILVTYDPKVVHGEASGPIVLNDFDGRKGLTLTLPADAQTRVFVLQE